MAKSTIYWAILVFALDGLTACAAPSQVLAYPAQARAPIPTPPRAPSFGGSVAALGSVAAAPASGDNPVIRIVKDCMSQISCRLGIQKDAAEGDPMLQTAIGQAYHNGWGVARDDAAAAEWWKAAADRGQPEAQYALGIAYIWGYGVPVDLRTAHFWLNRAVAKLDPGSLRNMAIDARDVIAPALSMSPDQLAAVQRKFRDNAAAAQ
jgi:TPR repeat protein